MALFHDKWPWRRDAEGRTVMELVPRWLRVSLGLLILAVAGGMMAIWTVGHDPARWHVDPLTAERTGKPNDYLVAPAGRAAASVDRVFAPVGESPEALMARFHAVAMEAPRVEVVAGAPEEGWVSYVQRSAVFGFPDYVSVKAVPVEGGAALAIWSRARYGHSDLGVNAARVERWLAAMGEGV